MHLWGDERVPRRTLVWNVVRSVDSVATEGEGWDRACLRVANVHSLIVKHAFSMPVDGDWLSAFLAAHVKSAEKGYGRARTTKELASTSDSNLALLRSFSGKGDEALGILEGLGGSLWRSRSRRRSSWREWARTRKLSRSSPSIPQENVDRRVMALRLRLEGNE